MRGKMRRRRGRKRGKGKKGCALVKGKNTFWLRRKVGKKEVCSAP
jgi:hypothetical protein